jgi:hypothetical protein
MDGRRRHDRLRDQPKDRWFRPHTIKACRRCKRIAQSSSGGQDSAVVRIAERILRAGLFHYRPHGLQVIGCGHDREKQNQNAGESQPGLRGLLVRPRTAFCGAPNAKGGHGQQQPDQIEQQFHRYNPVNRPNAPEAGLANSPPTHQRHGEKPFPSFFCASRGRIAGSKSRIAELNQWYWRTCTSATAVGPAIQGPTVTGSFSFVCSLDR